MSISFNSWFRTREPLGSSHWMTSLELVNHAWVLHAMGSTSEAGTLYHQSCSSFESQLGEFHPLTALAKYSIGWHETTEGNYSKAKSYLFQSIGILEHLHGNCHPDIATPKELLGWVSLFDSSFELAFTYASEALEITKSCYGDIHPNLILPLALLGSAMCRLGKTGKAHETMLEAEDIAHKANFSSSLDYAQLLICRAKLLFSTGDTELSFDALDHAQAIRKKLLPSKHHDLMIIASNLNLLVSIGTQAFPSPHYDKESFSEKFIARRFCGSSTM